MKRSLAVSSRKRAPSVTMGLAVQVLPHRPAQYDALPCRQRDLRDGPEPGFQAG